jgi:hypothetical protein
MEQVPSTEVIPAHQLPQDVVKLISKLRWIGMDDEARRRAGWRAERKEKPHA